MNKDRETVIIVRRRKVHGHGHHGGAWKVAFADFMTSMMALFLVLWLVTQSSDVKSAIAGYFQDPLGRAEEFGSSIIPGDGAQAAMPRPMTPPQVTDMRRDRLQRLGDQIRRTLTQTVEFRELAEHIEIELTDEGLRIQLLETAEGVFFETGSAQPRPAVTALLHSLGAQLGAYPNSVVLDGHTDAVPYVSKRPYGNWELSADRANTSRRILVSGGLRESQVTQVRGHADRELRNPADPAAPSNRRVTITMLFEPAGTAADSLAAGSPAADSLAADSLGAAADSSRLVVHAP